MSKTGRRPDPDSLQGRLRAFFDANPQEELTLEDAAVKFDATDRSVVHAVHALRRAGVLRSQVQSIIFRADRA